MLTLCEGGRVPWTKVVNILPNYCLCLQYYYPSPPPSLFFCLSLSLSLTHTHTHTQRGMQSEVNHSFSHSHTHTYTCTHTHTLSKVSAIPTNNGKLLSLAGTHTLLNLMLTYQKKKKSACIQEIEAAETPKTLR